MVVELTLEPGDRVPPPRSRRPSSSAASSRAGPRTPTSSTRPVGSLWCWARAAGC